MKSRKSIVIFLLIWVFVPRLHAQQIQFVSVKNGHFISNQKPWYYIGANYWYGSYLVIDQHSVANKERLLTELDLMKANGVTDLRVLAATEGDGFVNGVFRTAPALQTKAGVFDAPVLKGLDFILDAMRKRDMKAVLVLSNNWEWSGGFLQYVNWNGLLADSIMRRKLNWDEQRDYTSKFYTCDNCKKKYLEQVALILDRANSFSGVKYVNDPAIMAWELANEPRPMRPAVNKDYAKWVAEVAAFIKAKDKNHLVTIGNEGEMGTEDMELFKSIHADKNVDYLTIHIWPKNWGWFSDTAIAKGFDNVQAKTTAYINKHAAIARTLNKPLVIEEFGLPRDGHVYSLQSATSFRDKYYSDVFNVVDSSAKQNDIIAGCNFWAMGGLAKPIEGQVFWKQGDAYMGDPTGEEQGLNSVFASDASTWEVIRSNAAYLAAINSNTVFTPSDPLATGQTKNLLKNLQQLAKKGVMIGHQDDLAYGVDWKYVAGKSDVKEITGEYPAVYGWELGNIEHGIPYDLDSVPFDRMQQYIKEGYDRGGVITISWHADNPVNMQSAWDVTPGGVAAILPGGDKHDLYNAWLDRIADFMQGLKGSDGKAIPVLFRPFHELSGNWFWWGPKFCTPTEFKLLWRYTVNYLQNTRGLHNLLYVYNMADFATEEEFLERYPGDDVVDMISFDAYQNGDPSKDSFFLKNTYMRLGMIEKIGLEKHKLVALAEAGFEAIPYPEWWTKTMLPAVLDHNVSYVLFWRNAGLMKNGNMHYYISQKGDASAADFIKFYQDKRTLFQKEVAAENLYK